MNPMLAGLLLQGGGTLLSSLFGANRSRQEERRMRAFRAQLMRIASPQYLMGLQNQLYNQAIAGPAFGAARRGVFNASQGVQNRLQGSLAARGLSSSGVGSIAGALGGSAMAGQLGQLRTGLYGQAGQQAGQMQERELSNLQSMGAPQQPAYGTQAFAGGLGDISKFLVNYLEKPKESK